MELLSTDDYYILRHDEHSLWCSRDVHADENKPKITSKNASEVDSLPSYVCHGIVYGLVGLFNSDKLVLIRSSQIVGVEPIGGHHVFKIQRVAVVSLNKQPISEINLDHCNSHPLKCSSSSSSLNQLSSAPEVQSQSLVLSPPSLTSTPTVTGVQKTWNQIKSTASHVKPRVVGAKSSGHEAKDKYDKRILDELYKMFNNTDSFYYSLTGDLTNSLQRQQHKKQKQQQNQNENQISTSIDSIPLWKRVDDRFFWNKNMLSTLIEQSTSTNTNQVHSIDHWILPVIQGFFHIERCTIAIDATSLCPIEEAITPSSDSNIANSKSMEDVRTPVKDELKPGDEVTDLHDFTMVLISRRSRFRAGTRYKRRGVDEMGKCANYVETEQIFQYGSHIVSCVLVRGSVPVYWHQLGHKYKPPPIIDRNEEETQIAFAKHFQEELAIYGTEVIVNLVEQSGREKVIAEAYLNHILNLNQPDLTYVSFDFHDYCRGMKFENVSILIENVRDIIKDLRYCWIDKDGVICDQRGVFRVNCIDCLDRTNLVQTAIARQVMDIQFVRLGLLSPEGILPPNCRRTFQTMWANNGDILSRQYAGTNALKGDFTRTGERRFAGVMKDGYNSASRYYVNRFKDAYRQATIDIMLGIPVSDDLNSPDGDNTSGDVSMISESEHHERVKLVIEDSKKILIPDQEVVLGGWPLIDVTDNGYSSNMESIDMDTVLILTKESYYVAEYDEHTDRIVRYQRVLLEDLEKIELGFEPNQMFSIKSNKQNYCIRLIYLVCGQSGYFHMFRSTNTRFFNNMAIPIRNPEEAMESLKAICESFKVALSVKSLNVPYYEGKLERKKGRQHNIIGASSSRVNTNTNRDTMLTGESSGHQSGQLLNLKNVGSRALTNVSSHFARLKGKWSNGKQLETLNEPVDNTLPQSGSTRHGLVLIESSGEEDSEEESRSLRRKGSNEKKRSSMPTTLPSLMPSSLLPFAEKQLLERTASSEYTCSEYSDVDDQEIFTPPCDEEQSSSGPASNLSGDTLLESCGILATSPNANENVLLDNDGRVIRPEKESVFGDVDDFILDSMKKASLKQLHRKASESQLSISSQLSRDHDFMSSAPSIQINDSFDQINEQMSSSPEKNGNRMVKNRMVSKSSEDLDNGRMETTIQAKKNAYTSASFATLVEDEVVDITRTSNQDHYGNNNSLNVSGGSQMKTSHSETAIQDFSTGLSLNLQYPISSPIVIKKDLVLSPLSRIAKGVQHLGMNLRTGAAHAVSGSSSSHVGRRVPSRPHTPVDPEMQALSKQRKEACKSKIIEL